MAMSRVNLQKIRNRIRFYVNLTARRREDVRTLNFASELLRSEFFQTGDLSSLSPPTLLSSSATEATIERGQTEEGVGERNFTVDTTSNDNRDDSSRGDEDLVELTSRFERILSIIYDESADDEILFGRLCARDDDAVVQVSRNDADVVVVSRADHKAKSIAEALEILLTTEGDAAATISGRSFPELIHSLRQEDLRRRELRRRERERGPTSDSIRRNFDPIDPNPPSEEALRSFNENYDNSSYEELLYTSTDDDMDSDDDADDPPHVVCASRLRDIHRSMARRDLRKSAAEAIGMSFTQFWRQLVERGEVSSDAVTRNRSRAARAAIVSARELTGSNGGNDGNDEGGAAVADVGDDGNGEDVRGGGRNNSDDDASRDRVKADDLDYEKEFEDIEEVVVTQNENDDDDDDGQPMMKKLKAMYDCVIRCPICKCKRYGKDMAHATPPTEPLSSKVNVTLQTTCGHSLCVKCLNLWRKHSSFETRNLCPTCKSDVDYLRLARRTEKSECYTFSLLSRKRRFHIVEKPVVIPQLYDDDENDNSSSSSSSEDDDNDTSNEATTTATSDQIAEAAAKVLFTHFMSR